VEESKSVCGVQDGQGSENTEIQLHFEMEEEVSGRQLVDSESESEWGSAGRNQEIV
jgi:hypothetical protein